MNNIVRRLLPISVLAASGAAGVLLADCDVMFARGVPDTSSQVLSYGSCDGPYSCVYQQCGPDWSWAQQCAFAGQILCFS